MYSENTQSGTTWFSNPSPPISSAKHELWAYGPAWLFLQKLIYFKSFDTPYISLVPELSFVIINVKEVNVNLESHPHTLWKWAVVGGCLITVTFTGKIFSSRTQPTNPVGIRVIRHRELSITYHVQTVLYIKCEMIRPLHVPETNIFTHNSSAVKIESEILLITII